MSENLMPDETRQQLGGIVRQLHDALQTLGYDTVLHEVTQEIPDARERLAYVGAMTEQAADRVLTLVDMAKPECTSLVEQGRALLAADPPSEQLKAFAERSVEVASLQQDALNDIMMAQDFQDLSGQVINKVIKIITRTEKQLLELLVSHTPQAKVETVTKLEGPQTPDKAMKQDDVDDLLASLGF
ncbi:MAG: chemotaxis protein CheZ [Pseudomonadota bacterium]|nr:chemotaxis protein CheZ [Pseudomonadota bacterium]